MPVNYQAAFNKEGRFFLAFFAHNVKSGDMIIDLKGLPEAGEDYKFNHKSEELHGVLTDLVGKNPFSIELRIEPLGNTFQIRGQFNSHFSDDCSSCGKTIDVPVENKINEILVIEDIRPRTTQSTHGPQSMDFSGKGPSVTYINSSQFNLADFVHEMFAFSMPSYPRCSSEKDCAPVIKGDDGQVGDRGHPAFSVLKKIKTEH